ncbi:MAG TPA: MFS transporter [Dehalococcoidia bacterium]|nr:MFS transporter [Dehalococcoidia bacterium]
MIKKAFPVLSLSIFSSMLGVGIIAPLLPLYADNLGATGIWLGIIFSGFSISRAIFLPIFGRLADRSGRKLFICIGLLFYSILSLGYIWASSLSQLTLVRLLHGAAAGMIIPIAQAYIGDISPVGEEGKWMGYFNAAFFTGFGFGPLMGGALTEHFGMTVAFSTMGGLNLLAFLLVTLFLPEIRQRKTATSHHLSFKKMSSSSIVRGIFSFRLSFALGRGAFACFLPIFAAMCIDLSPALIGVLLAVNILLMALFQPFSGKIADRYNRRALVITGSLINFTFLALIPVAHNFWYLLGVCALGGLGGAISMPAASALVVDEGRKFGMGSTFAIFTLAMSIGMAVGSLSGGVIADLLNVNSVFYFAAVIGLIGTSLFTWFTR